MSFTQFFEGISLSKNIQELLRTVSELITRCILGNNELPVVLYVTVIRVHSGFNSTLFFVLFFGGDSVSSLPGVSWVLTLASLTIAIGFIVFSRRQIFRS